MFQRKKDLFRNYMIVKNKNNSNKIIFIFGQTVP